MRKDYDQDSSKKDMSENEVMKNDEFNLLLALLRKKKAATKEKNPYYIEYSTRLHTVYQVDNNMEENENLNNSLDIEDFTKTFIEDSDKYYL